MRRALKWFEKKHREMSGLTGVKGGKSRGVLRITTLTPEVHYKTIVKVGVLLPFFRFRRDGCLKEGRFEKFGLYTKHHHPWRGFFKQLLQCPCPCGMSDVKVGGGHKIGNPVNERPGRKLSVDIAAAFKGIKRGQCKY